MAELRYTEGFTLFSNVDDDKTLAANDQGRVQNVIADEVTVTLPAAAAGLVFTVRAGGVPAGGPVGSGANKSLALDIATNGSETITGLGASSANNLIVDKTDNVVGDFVTLIGRTGGWNIVEAAGAWKRAA